MSDPARLRVRALWPLRHNGRRSELRTLVSFLRQQRKES